MNNKKSKHAPNPRPVVRRLMGGLLALALTALGTWGVLGPAGPAPEATARSNPELTGRMPEVALTALPPEGQRVFKLIESGGPFKYEKDGTVFGNRERLLPLKNRGHYREYTVDTPGLRHRGARRIVCGGQQPRRPESCFYTDDHYLSFSHIRW